MKTKQELLDFYGVEIGKKYKVTKVGEGVSKHFKGDIFKIRESPAVDELIIMFAKHSEYSIRALNYLDYEEIKPSILDDKEREYLQKYVMDNPAFKGKVEFIGKLGNLLTDFERITISMQNDTNCGVLPAFKRGSMYKGMESHRYYTPKELGLKE